MADGTNRIGDIEFRLCEVTPGCDPLNMTATAPLGGDTAAATVAPTETTAPAGGPELAVGEQADFDRAKEVLGQGDFPRAAELFATFTQSYPGGPLTQEAHYLRGEALRQSGDTANAARAYLEAYSGNPQGNFAADSLLKLGQALGDLGQTPEACVTLAEVATQYPGTTAATQGAHRHAGAGVSVDPSGNLAPPDAHRVAVALSGGGDSVGCCTSCATRARMLSPLRWIIGCVPKARKRPQESHNGAANGVSRITFWSGLAAATVKATSWTGRDGRGRH